MRFYKKLYTSAGIKNSKKICSKLKRGVGQLSIYVIALAGGSNQLEFYHCAYLKQKALYRQNPHIIGVAGSYDEAMELIEKIISDIFAKTGNYNIKDYFTREDSYI